MTDPGYPMVADCSDRIAARIPGCRQLVIPGADHMLPLRAPGRLAEIIAGNAGGPGPRSADAGAEPPQQRALDSRP